jgi:UDP-N-acetylglucosamine diphosphorylase/glucosamine-1-phosphate N-acetyltransferase
MNYILFDDILVREHLLPFTFTRPISEIRIGILTISEKWEFELGQKVSFKTEKYLSEKYPEVISAKEDNVWINGSILPGQELVKAIKKLGKDEAIFSGNTPVAMNGNGKSMKQLQWEGGKLFKIERLWDIFSKNGEALEQDFARLCKGKKSSTPSSTNTLIGKNIFIEEGAKLECAIINSISGPVYIGKDAEIMEGAIIKGPVALCEGSIVKAGAKIYGATTIGPFSKVGGEVNNAVIFSYSNKGHDGFLGNAVIGEWCNLGADTNNSNLKNNYSIVKMWDYAEGKEVSTGLIFCGLIMGDHSKCGINTMFNTGTVVGTCCNIFGADFPKKYIPSFSWGGASGFTIHELEKACQTAERMFERRHKKFDMVEKKILAEVFSITEKHRLTY